MVYDDIGRVIFVDFYRMAEYPGAPFSGNTANDLIMFLLVPSVFIILFVIVLLGRIIDPTHRGLRALVGLTVYLFIVAGGYYRAFAYLAGPYFIFLIFFLGLVYFIPSHFGRRATGLPSGASSTERVNEGQIKHFLGIPTLDPMERNELEHQLRIINATLEKLSDIGRSGGKVDSSEVARLMAEKGQIERKLYGKYYSGN